jgi:hypothetical protein
MNVEIGAAAALFPEKEYINGIAVAVFDIKGFSEFKNLFSSVLHIYTEDFRSL